MTVDEQINDNNFKRCFNPQLAESKEETSMRKSIILGVALLAGGVTATLVTEGLGRMASVQFRYD